MKKRIITALLIVAVSAPLIILGGWFNVLFASFICFAGVTEICRAGGKGKNWSPVVYVAIYLSTAAILYWNFILAYVNNEAAFLTIPSPYSIRVNFWVIIAVLICFLMLEVVSHNFSIIDVFYCFSTIIIISIGCQGIIYIREVLGLRACLYLIVITCGCDSAAHIFGSRFGHKKLAPIISPSKTWEGAIAGCIFATIVGTTIFIAFPFIKEDGTTLFFSGLVLSIILSIGAVFGDLVFSSIKRQSNIKDFSNALPGHGGILDRVDSLLFNVLVFLVIYNFVISIGI